MCLPSGGLCSSVIGNGLNDLKLGGHFSLHMGIINRSDNILKYYSLITTWLFSFSGYRVITLLMLQPTFRLFFLRPLFYIYLHYSVFLAHIFYQLEDPCPVRPISFFPAIFCI